jgi:hypothetical protein
VHEEKRAQREQVSFCLGLVAIKLEVRRDKKRLFQGSPSHAHGGKHGEACKQEAGDAGDAVDDQHE